MKFTQEISIFNPKAIKYAVTALGTRITQTAEEIRLEAEQTLSNYSTTIQMNSAISQKANQITTEVSQTYATQSSQTTAVNSLSSRITQNANSITSEVTARGNADSALSSRIAQTLKSITFNITNNSTNTAATLSMSVTNEGGSTTQLTSKNINLTGLVTISDLAGNGTTTINGSNIKTGTIDASQVTVSNINASNITTGTMTGREISGGRIIQTVTNPQHGGLPGNDSDGQQAKIENGIVTCGELAVKGSVTTVSIVPEGGDGRGSYGLYCTGHFSTEGALWTNGSIGEADIICRGNAFAQNFIQSSDRDLKTDIEPLARESACSVVYGLKPMTFRLKEQTEVKRHGFIAQDVQDLVRDDWGIVTESDVKLIDGRKTLALNYTELIADIVAAIQSQNDRITELERRTA